MCARGCLGVAVAGDAAGVVAEQQHRQVPAHGVVAEVGRQVAARPPPPLADDLHCHLLAYGRVFFIVPVGRQVAAPHPPPRPAPAPPHTDDLLAVSKCS